jgi:aspartyl-tRNA(Asn)/glutamyl-tRNA(Gln) amidotransferase subunit C
MKITREDVLRVADLAYLDLTDKEVETYQRQLDSILTYVEKLNELDTAGVEPMAQVAPPGAQSFAGTPLREDMPAPCDISREVLAGAPEATATHFRVPKVIER